MDKMLLVANHSFSFSALFVHFSRRLNDIEHGVAVDVVVDCVYSYDV